MSRRETPLNLYGGRSTRRQRANELLERLKKGPSFRTIGVDLDEAEAAAQYQRWVASWILDEVGYLVPELREAVRHGFGRLVSPKGGGK